MSNINVGEHRRTSAAIAARLSEVSIPKALAPIAKSFLSAQSAYEKACVLTEAAEAARDKALADVSSADGALDASVDALVDLLPGAKLGTRAQPLKAFTNKSPTDLKAMPYAAEPDEVDRVVAKILAKKPGADIVKACKTASTRATDVRGKMKAYGAKQAAYDRARTTRDALLPALQKARESLKRHASVAWENDAATFKSVFAAPTRVEAPKKKKRAKKPAPPAPVAAPPTPPASTNGAPS